MQRRVWRVAYGLFLAAMLGITAFVLSGGPGEPVSTFEWRMVERTGLDADRDGIADDPSGDLGSIQGYIDPEQWTIELDACDTAAAERTDRFVWSLTKEDAGEIVVDGTCQESVQLPELGVWRLRLEAGGGITQLLADEDIHPRDLFVVSIGDSVASGEGNPDMLETSSVTSPFGGYAPVWQEQQCHRSGLAGPAQAARRLEKRDPHTSVTFVHLACSGAEITAGLLQPYAGIDPDDLPPKAPQLEQAQELHAIRAIDALTVSIGANDVHFSDVVKLCLAVERCDKAGGPDLLAEHLPGLPDRYDTLAGEITGRLALPSDRVFLTKYFDPTTGDDGAVCPTVEGFEPEEWEWAGAAVVGRLNLEAGEAADRNGWTMVDGTDADFLKHGYCARDRWVRTLTESALFQLGPDGAFHPNSEGHGRVYGPRIEAALAQPLAIGGTPIPIETDPIAAPVGDALSSAVGLLDGLDVDEQLGALTPYADAKDAVRGAIEDVRSWLGQRQAEITTIAGQGSQSLARLDLFLDDPDQDGDTAIDGRIGGAPFDVEVSITPHTPARVYDLVIKVRGGRPISTGLSHQAGGLVLAGPDVAGELELDSTFHIRIDGATEQVALHGLDQPVAAVGADLDASYTTGEPLEARVGLVGAQVLGTVSADASVGVSVADPDGNGITTIDELNVLTPGQRLSGGCASGGAAADLTIRGSLAGLPVELARIVGNDSDLCEGFAPPSVTLGTAYGDLEAFGPLEALRTIVDLARHLRTMQEAGDVDLPFADLAVSDFIDITDGLLDVLETDQLVDPSNRLQLRPGEEIDLSRYDTIEELLDLLGRATADGGVSARYVDRRIVFDIVLTGSVNGAQRQVSFDFVDELLPFGLSQATGTGALTGSGSFRLDVGLGADLRAGVPIEERVFLETTGTELTLDARVSGRVTLGATLGPLAAGLESSGDVTLLSPQPHQKLLTLDIGEPAPRGSGPDPYLTGGDIARLLNSGVLPLRAEVRGQVETFDLAAAVTLAERPLAHGGLLVEWTDLAQPGTLTVTPYGGFDVALMPLAFSEDPLVLVGQVLQIARDASHEIVQELESNVALQQRLPLVDRRPDELVPFFHGLRSALDRALLLNRSATLDEAAAAMEQVVYDHTGVRPDIDLRYRPGTPGVRAAVDLSFDLGICSSDRKAGAPAGCSAGQDLPPLEFALPIAGGVDAPSIIGLTGSGSASISYDGGLHLAARVLLPRVTSTPTGPEPSGEALGVEVLPETSLQLGIGIKASAAFGGVAGPFTVDVGRAGGPAVKAALAVRFVITPGGVVSDATDPTFPSGCASGHDACAEIPVFLSGAPMGTATFRAPDVLAPAGWTFDDGGILAKLNSGAFDLVVLVEGLDRLALGLEQALATIPPGTNIPLIGGDLSSGADVVRSLREEVIAPVKAGLVTVAQSSAGQVETAVAAKIDEVVPPGLRFHQATTVIASCRLGTGALERCAPTANPQNIARLEVRMRIGRGGQVTSEAFDIGFPGLNFQSEQGLRATATWSIDLTFGLDRRIGPYLDTNNRVATSTASPEVSLTSTLGVVRDPAGSGGLLRGELAFLPVSLRDTTGADEAAIRLGIDLSGGATDGLLSARELDVDITPSIEACVNLAVELQTTKAPDDASELPKLIADLGVLAGYNCPTTGISGVAGRQGVPGDLAAQVSLNNVRMDVGTFVSGMLRPVASKLHEVTRHVEPAVDAVRQPVPGINELAKATNSGIQAPTWKTLLDGYCLATGSEACAALDKVIFVTDLTRSLTTGNGVVQLGSYSLDSAMLDAATGDPESIARLVGLPTAGSAAANPLAEALGKVELNPELRSKLAAGTGGLTFPAFSKPQLMVQYLFGRDVTLVQYDTGPIDAEAKMPPLEFWWGPVNIGVNGKVAVGGRVIAGFDTCGIRKTLAIFNDGNPDNNDGFDALGSIAEGFYVEDRERTSPTAPACLSPGLGLAAGADPAEFTFHADISIHAGLGVPNFQLKVVGSIYGDASIDLFETPTGRVRISDISGKLLATGNPICLFNVKARIGVGLDVVTVTPLATATHPVAHHDIWTLPDYSEMCAAQPSPETAVGGVRPDGNPGHVQILGDAARNKITLAQTGPTSMLVTNRGKTHEFTNVTSVAVEAFGGDDSVTISPANGVVQEWRLPLVVDAGEGADEIAASTRGAFGLVELRGQAGNDRIEGDTGSQVIDGGDGDDRIIGSPTIAAGDNCFVADPPTAGIGSIDFIDGGAGNDLIRTGWEAETIVGGSGIDTVDYSDRAVSLSVNLRDGVIGTGNRPVEDRLGEIERVQTGPCRDFLTGGDGDDVLDGGLGDDELAGGAGADTILGGPGEDGLQGQHGADSLDGGPETDDLYGHQDPDTLIGGGGQDELWGGPGDDRLDGGDENDRLFGEAGRDLLNGGAGDDRLEDPTIDGDHGMHGGEGRDVIDYSALVTPADLSLDGFPNDGPAGSALFDQIGFEAEVLVGSTGGGAIVGSDGSNELVARGPGTIAGGQGDDVLHALGAASGGPGDDQLFLRQHGNGPVSGDGGPGFDRISITTAVTGGIVPTLSGGAGPDHLFGSEVADAIDGGDGNDFIKAQGGADVVHGGADQDNVFGGEGDDTLRGDTGHDLLDGEGGSDTLEGGTGNDQLRSCAPDQGGTAACSGDELLRGGPGTDGLYGGYGTAQLFGDDGNDALNGSGALATLDGGAGDDHLLAGTQGGTLRGGSGNDTLLGNHGPDVLVGGDGADDIEGSQHVWGVSPVDVVDLSAASGPVRISLDGEANDGGANDGASLGATRGDNYRHIALLIGTSADDTLVGSPTNTERLLGGPGRDVLRSGGATDDYLDGGPGADLLEGEIAGSGIADYSARTTAVTVTLDGVANDGGPIDNEGVKGNPFADDVRVRRVLGSSADDRLTGGEGDDWFDGGRGADTFAGGAGTDTVSYATAPGPIYAAIGSAAENGPVGEGDTLGADLESLIGSAGSDHLAGGLRAGTIEGGAGDDHLRGSPEADFIRGGDGVDELTVGSPSGEVIDLDGRFPTPLVPTVDHVLDVENARGGSGPDTLIGTDGENRLLGGGGDDVLIGREGFDHLDGEGGDDTIRPGYGLDAITDTAGSTTIDLSDVDEADVGARITFHDGRLVLGLLPPASVDPADPGIATESLRFLQALPLNTHGVIGTPYSDHLDLSSRTLPVRIDGAGGADLLVGTGAGDLLRPGNDLADSEPGRIAAGLLDRVTAGGGVDRVDLGDVGDPDELGVCIDLAPLAVQQSLLGQTRAAGQAFRSCLEPDLEGKYRRIRTEGVELVDGSPAADLLFGAAGAEQLRGGGGRDQIDGRAGNDTIDGQGGRDLVYEGAAQNGADVLQDTGSDASNDVLSYLGRTSPVAVTVNGIADDGEAGEGDDVRSGFETLAGAKVAPTTGDFDGDGDADVTIFRPDGSTWFAQGALATGWGQSGDIPVLGDFNGDGRSDATVYRQNEQEWYAQANNGWEGIATQWGILGDIPIPADYDGDGDTDITVFRPSDQTWYAQPRSGWNGLATQWGIPGDVPIPADYDGDGDDDVAVFRPSDQTWYVQGGLATQWGIPGDIPVPADYDGDGDDDVAVFRPSDQTWYVQGGLATQWGVKDDVAVPADYDGDGDTDVAVYRLRDSTWYVQNGLSTQWGRAEDIPVIIPFPVRELYGFPFVR
jgi:Ca2+-binding RTX toxin-like protein